MRKLLDLSIINQQLLPKQTQLPCCQIQTIIT